MFPWMVAAGGMFGKEILVFTFHVNYPFVYHRELSGLPERDGLPVKSGYSSSSQWTIHNTQYTA